MSFMPAPRTKSLNQFIEPHGLIAECGVLKVEMWGV